MEDGNGMLKTEGSMETSVINYPTVDSETGKIVMNSSSGDDESSCCCCYYSSKGRIDISAEEERLFETLMNAAIAYETGQMNYSNDNSMMQQQQQQQQREKNKKVELRVAGGWVRDKLLGMNSDDVDIALDTLMGVEFATLVQKYLLEQQQHNNNNNDDSEEHSNEKKKKKKQLFKIGVISANPEQSKHLETATMNIYGMDVDFVNLRAQETYEENSRIPTVQFGSPLEDALRRDFTVNALFYNIRTRQLEDWTARGMSDLLHRRLLVTPFPPLTTFHDDPLRVLRAVRFAIRFNLTVHSDIQQAALHPKVQQSLMLKVSRERIGKELEGMLSGKSAKPHQALSLIVHLQLTNCLFSLPPSISSSFQTDWSLSSSKPLSFIPSTLQLYNNIITEQNNNNNKQQHLPPLLLDHQRLLYLATFLLPLKGLTYLDKKNKPETVIAYIVRESIKFKNKDVSSMQTIMNHFDTMELIIQKLQHNTTFSRLEVGLLLRNLKELWPVCCLLVYSKILEEATICQFFHLVQHHNLNECWKQRPLLDGRALISLLNLPKGPGIGKYLQLQTEWMLLNPNGTKDECAKHLQTIRQSE